MLQPSLDYSVFQNRQIIILRSVDALEGQQSLAPGDEKLGGKRSKIELGSSHINLRYVMFEPYISHSELIMTCLVISVRNRTPSSIR